MVDKVFGVTDCKSSLLLVGHQIKIPKRKFQRVKFQIPNLSRTSGIANLSRSWGIPNLSGFSVLAALREIFFHAKAQRFLRRERKGGNQTSHSGIATCLVFAS
jgi:hypothetical protein